MKRPLCFLVGAALAVGLMLTGRATGDQRLASLRGDAMRVAELDRRIDSNPKPIDIAFFGSSHTVMGVADRLIEHELARAGRPLSVANLGSYYMGRDLQLFELRRTLERHRPRLVVIEVSDHEFEFGHQLLPYVGDVADLLCCRTAIDPYFPRHFALFLKLKTTHALQGFSGHVPPAPAVKEWDHGWDPGHAAMAPAAFEAAAAAPGRWLQFKDRLHGHAAHYGLDAVERMVRLAREGGAKVAFLYLPAVRYLGRQPPVSLYAYSRHGPIIELPEHFGRDASLWFDEYHLHRSGAERLAPVVAQGVLQAMAATPNP